MSKAKLYFTSLTLPFTVSVAFTACSESSSAGPQGTAVSPAVSSEVITTGASTSTTDVAPVETATGPTNTPPPTNSSTPVPVPQGQNPTGSTETISTTDVTSPTTDAASSDSNGTTNPPTTEATSVHPEPSSAPMSAVESSGSEETSGVALPDESVLHVFMLMGQSNMAGVAKAEASDKTTDERIKVLGGCNQPAGQWNLAKPPLSDCPGEKGWNLSDSVDPGTWFAKTLVEKLPAGDSIGLVGTAESGESINTFISGGTHHQMILNKIAQAKAAPNAHFAGIIFHQGESDNGQSSWPGKVVQLYNEVKEAWGVDYDVPFILGELPAGGCCSGHNNLVHQAADQLPIGAWVTQDGTKVMDEYHFDHASVILMGQRYGEKMIEELGW